MGRMLRGGGCVAIAREAKEGSPLAMKLIFETLQQNNSPFKSLKNSSMLPSH